MALLYSRVKVSDTVIPMGETLFYAGIFREYSVWHWYIQGHSVLHYEEFKDVKK